MGTELLPNQDFTAELTTGERPLLDRWVRETLPVFRIREGMVNDLLSGSIVQDIDTTIFQNGIKVPNFLIPIMKRWAQNGPAILCSYAHPEVFDLYKFTGRLNLVSFIDRMREQGVVIPKERVTENWYETVALDRSVTTPLKFGDTFPQSERFPIKHDLFGLGNFHYGTEVCDLDQIQEAMNVDSRTTASLILRRLSNEVETELVILGGNRLERGVKRDILQGLLEQRLASVLGLVDLVISNTVSSGELTVNEFLINLQRQFAGHVLNGEHGIGKDLDGVTGIESQLLSKNRKYLELVLDTLNDLISTRGSSVLKRLVAATGDGLFSGFVDDQDVLLTVDSEEDRFILMNKRSWETEKVVGDGKLIEFVRDNNLLPLAKAETLAILAGGMTFHMGSEYGSRPRILSNLGIKRADFPEFFDYLSGLRIGQDSEQGNGLFNLIGSERPIPAVLAFILFGERFLRAKILENIGLLSGAQKLHERELKSLVAKTLVKNLEKI